MGTIVHDYATFEDGQKIVFSYWPGSGNHHASIVTDGQETDQWTFVPAQYQNEPEHLELGLRGAKELVERLHPENQGVRKIYQIKDLRTASKAFWNTTSVRRKEDQQQASLESITFDYAMATAEVYVGEDTTAYYFFADKHEIKVQITAVKVEGVWKKLHIKFPDRVVKHESRAGLRNFQATFLDSMVEEGKLELLV